FFFQAEDGIRDGHVTGVQTCALPILKTLRVPKRLTARPGTGSTKGPVHRRPGPDRVHRAESSAASCRMRSRRAAGGLTNASSTVSVRVGKSRGSTRRGYVM